jgi:hypothetical protein
MLLPATKNADGRTAMSEENKELVRRYYAEILNGRNLDAVGDYFADERMVEGVRRGCFTRSFR